MYSIRIFVSQVDTRITVISFNVFLTYYLFINLPIVRPRPHVTFCKKLYCYAKQFQPHAQIPKLEDQPL
jgi:hypothetical protein